MSISMTMLKHVLAVEEDRAVVGERELARRDRRQRGAGIHDERVPPDAGEDPHAASRATVFVVDTEADRSPLGATQVPCCTWSGLADVLRRAEDAVEDQLLVARDEPPRGASLRGGVSGPQPEAVEQPRGEEIGGLGHRQGVQDQDEATRVSGLGNA